MSGKLSDKTNEELLDILRTKGDQLRAERQVIQKLRLQLAAAEEQLRWERGRHREARADVGALQARLRLMGSTVD